MNIRLCSLPISFVVAAAASTGSSISQPSSSRLQTPLLHSDKPSKLATRVTGFASSKQTTVLLPSPKENADKANGSKEIKKKKKNKGNKKRKTDALPTSSLSVYYSPSEGVLYFRSQDEESEEDRIIQISAHKERIWDCKVSDTTNITDTIDNNSNNQNWIPLEGIFGVYIIPSGTIWVLITGSELVYDAPAIYHQTPQPVTPTTSQQNSTSSWFRIRRVTDIELVHIPCRLLSVPQLKEEVRQVQLFRKSLKQHAFYYTEPIKVEDTATATTTINDANDDMLVQQKVLLPTVPTGTDMTKNLQRSFRAFLSKKVNQTKEEDSTSQEDENSTSSESISWWEDPSNKKHKCRPDSRFFWNEAAVLPLIGRYHEQKDQSESENTPTRLLLEKMIPLTSAFVGVQRQIQVVEVEQGTQTAVKEPFLVYDELLISRRSRLRAGTRFTKRGADTTGSVANYAETEQVCFLLQNITIGNDLKTNKSKKQKQKREQQQVLDRVCSHVQTRGSIPLRWSSPTDIKTYRPRVRIGMDPMAQTRALLAHVLEQLSLYALEDDDSLQGLSSLESSGKNLTTAKLIFVNLIDKKSDQGRLGRAFDAVLNAVMDVYAPPNATALLASSTTDNNGTQTENGNATTSDPESLEMQQVSNPQVITLEPNSVEHVWYDFHAEVKNGRWDRLAKLLKQIEPALLDHGYFCVAAPNQSDPAWKVLNQQRAVVRTNCMDCLDRTNVVQSLFGRWMLFHQLQQYRPSRQGQDIDEVKASNTTNRVKVGLPLAFVSAYKKNSLTLPWNIGEVSHRLLWADNADAISRLYAGTPALKGDFTRTGKRTKRGALDDGMNSLQRYYLNNFLDADRQEGTDLMVGYAAFSNLDDATATSNKKEGTAKGKDAKRSEMTLQEAARQMLLGNNVFQSQAKDDDDDDEQSFARIKKYKEHHPFLRKSLDNVVGGASTSFGLGRQSTPSADGAATDHPPLDLRWLPGDLQDHMRSRAIMADADDGRPKTGFSPVAALASIDRRAASDEPWWIVPDLTDDENDDSNALVDHEEARSDPGAKKIHAGYILSSFLLGTLAPTCMAATVVALLGAIVFPADYDTADADTEDEDNL